MFNFFNLTPRKIKKAHKVFTWFAIFSLVLQLNSGLFLTRKILAAEESPLPEPTPIVEETVETTPEPSVEPTPEATPEISPTPEPPVQPSAEPSPEPTPSPETSPTPEPSIEVTHVPSPSPETLIDPALAVIQGNQETTIPEGDFDLGSEEISEASAELNPSLLTDKEDYAPTDTAIITGSSFPINSELSIRITWPDGQIRDSAGNIGVSDKII